MAEFDVYRERLMRSGKTERERWIGRIQNQMETGMQNNPSYHTVSVAGKSVGMCINSTDTAAVKKFFTPCTAELYIGDYIV